MIVDDRPNMRYALRLCLNSRNGIELIDLSQVVYLKADGNYTDFFYVDGKVKTHLSSLAYFVEDINKLYAEYRLPCPFFRISRSFYINVNYVSAVNITTRTVSFYVENLKSLPFSRKLLKPLQDFIYEMYTTEISALRRR